MSINNRFDPSHPVGQSIVYGLDFSPILPAGVTIQSGAIKALYNTVPPTPTFDLTVTPLTPTPNTRRIYATVSGGTSGSDYRINWTANDSLGNTWIRSTLLLCAATS